MPTPLQEVTDQARVAGPASHKTVSTIQENFQSSFDVHMREDLSISRWLLADPEIANNKKLSGYIDSGEIPRAVVNQYTGPTGLDTDGLSYYARSHLGLDVNTPEEIKQDTIKFLGEARSRAQDIATRATTGGRVAGFAGMMAAEMFEPVFWGTMFVGPAAKGATWLATLGKNFAKFGLFEAGAEALKQPFVHDWKENIGVEHTIKDSLNAIAMVGLTAGTVGALIGHLANLGRYKVKGNASSDVSEGYIKEIVYDLKKLDPNANVVDELEKINGIDKAHGKGSGQREVVEQAEKDFETDELLASLDETDLATPVEPLEKPLNYAEVEGVPEVSGKSLGEIIENTSNLEEQFLLIKACVAHG